MASESGGRVEERSILPLSRTLKPYILTRTTRHRNRGLSSACTGAGATEAERGAIVDLIARDPTCGDVIVGTGGARKVRFARKGAGKSGGFRIITFFAAVDVPVFLLDLYGKGDKANLSKAERNDLAQVLGQIGAAYRADLKATTVKAKQKDG